MIVNYYSKDVFGQRLFYLANDEASRKWRHLTGRKTITELDMRFMTELTGVQFNRVFDKEEN